jgi:hypothetical protein
MAIGFSLDSFSRWNCGGQFISAAPLHYLAKWIPACTGTASNLHTSDGTATRLYIKLRDYRILLYNQHLIEIRNQGKGDSAHMSHVIAPFEVASKALAEPAKVLFVQIFSGIATRHSDTMDCIFLVNGEKALVAISCAALTKLREGEGKYLSDQQLAEIAALHLRRTLELGYDAAMAEIPLNEPELVALGTKLHYL